MENKIFNYVDIRTEIGYYRFAGCSLKEAFDNLLKAEKEPNITAIHCYC
jgi:hypothetical protein